MRTSVLVLALLALGACKSSPSPTRDVVTPMNASARITPEERASGEVMAVLRSQCVAWNRGDLEAYMSAGYWNSPELTFYSGGNATKGYDATLEHYKKSYQAEGATMGHLEFYGLETLEADVREEARARRRVLGGAEAPAAGLAHRARPLERRRELNATQGASAM